MCFHRTSICENSYHPPHIYFNAPYYSHANLHYFFTKFKLFSVKECTSFSFPLFFSAKKIIFERQKKHKNMGINKAIIVGNVGQDPDIRYVESNVCVANFTVATTEKGYSSATGTKIPDRTEWHNIVAWRSTAEYIEKYVKKGDLVYIEGKLRTRTWNDKSGIQRYITEIYVDTFLLLNSKKNP